MDPEELKQGVAGSMKTGLIDIGGGLRAVYAAGVLDRCMDDGITFDLGIGVSAGSANVAAFMAGQRGRNYLFYTEYSFEEEYMSRANIRSKGCLLDVKYVYGTLSNTDGKNPFGYEAFRDNPMEFIGVATNAETGQVKYFGKQDFRLNYYNVLMASSAQPYMCTPQDVDGVLYYDGDVSDPFPLEKALAEGCDKIIVIINQLADEKHSSEEDIHSASRLRDKYPRTAEALLSRAIKYNAGVELAKKLSDEGIVRIIAPDDLCGVETLCRDRDAMHKLYLKGYQDGAEIGRFLASR